jgi:hypothetical protein
VSSEDIRPLPPTVAAYPDLVIWSIRVLVHTALFPHLTVVTKIVTLACQLLQKLPDGFEHLPLIRGINTP